MSFTRKILSGILSKSCKVAENGAQWLAKEYYGEPGEVVIIKARWDGDNLHCESSGEFRWSSALIPKSSLTKQLAEARTAAGQYWHIRNGWPKLDRTIKFILFPKVSLVKFFGIAELSTAIKDGWLGQSKAFDRVVFEYLLIGQRKTND